MTDAFGVELRRRRIAAGMSLAELGRRVNYSKGYLSKIETGAMPPSEYLARRCEAELGGGGALAGLVAGTIADSAQETADIEDPAVWLMSLGPEGGSAFLPVGRREVLRAGAASLAVLTVRPPALPPRLGTPDPVPMFRALFDQTRALGQTTSPSLMLPLVVAQAQALRALVAGAAPAAAGPLALLAARIAEYAGWMAQESGDDRAALWWTSKAVGMAAEAGDRDLATYALVRQALVALYRRDARETVALAVRAQVDGRTPARILGLAAQREAQGRALAGEHDACLRALDRAARLLAVAEAESPERPVLGTTHVSDPVAVVSGWCLYDLGRPRAAAEILDREVARIPRGALRARVRFGVRRALAHASAGEVDHACALTGELLDATAVIDSATVRTDVRRLADTLRRWHTHPAVRELVPRITGCLAPA